jgi:hypothetical protein
VAVLLEGTSFNATWFIDGNLAPWRDHLFPGEGDPIRKDWWLVSIIQGCIPHK